MRVIEDQPAVPVEDRQFQIKGETFTIRDGLTPEVFAGLEDAQYMPTSIGIVQALDEAIKRALVDSDRERWEALRSNNLDRPVRLAEMRKVADLAIEIEAGLPPTPPGSSSPGEPGTPGTSVAPSGSQEATPTS